MKDYNEIAKKLSEEGFLFYRIDKKWYVNGKPIKNSLVNKHIRLHYEITTIQELAEVRYAFDDIYGE